MNDSSSYNTIRIGPGIGAIEIACNTFYELYENKLPVVLDADKL